MFRYAAVLTLSMLANPAWADVFDTAAVAKQYTPLDDRCYQGDAMGITVEESDAACIVRDKLANEFFANGWCFEMGDRAWTDVCPVGAKSFWKGPPAKPVNY